jgi:hypothetical protein
LSSLFRYLRAHSVLVLLFLSPGIPEYLSSSSSFNAIILNPGQFVFQLALNLGLYGPGVILIREAKIRWNKGWASVLLLGAAYGILEEGVALSTLYNSSSSVVGKLGFYGHYLGVNWVWLFGLLPFHAIYSISIPILLLGLALPETNGKSLMVSRKKIASAFAILGADVSVLFLFVLEGQHFWMGWPIFLSSFAAIGLLVFIARKLPADFLCPKTETPLIGPVKLAILGGLFFPAMILIESVLGVGIGIPPPLEVVFMIGVEILILYYLLKAIGRENNQRHIVAFVSGLIVPLAIFGLAFEIKLPLILIVDLGLAAFFWKVIQKYVSGSQKTPITSDVVSHDLSN